MAINVNTSTQYQGVIEKAGNPQNSPIENHEILSSIDDRPEASDFGIGSVQIDTVSYRSDGQKWVESKTGPSKLGIPIINLLQTEYVSELTQSIIAGTGTPTIVHDDSLGKITIELGAGLTGRGFKSLPAYTFLAGHTYCLSFYVSEWIGPSSAQNIIDTVAAVTLDFGTKSLSSSGISAYGTHAVIFQPTTDQAVTFRVGFGIPGNATGAAVTGSKMVFKDIAITDLSVCGINIPPYAVRPRMGANIVADYAGALATDTSGRLTLTANTKYAQKGLSIAIFGDSYVNDTTDYPTQLQALTYPRVGVWFQPTTAKSTTVAGTRPVVYLATLQTKMQSLIDSGLAPKYVLIQSSLNTINSATEATRNANIVEDLATIRTAAEWLISKGLSPIFTNITAWKTGAGANWITNGVYLSQQKWDALIYSLGAELGVPVFNLRGCIEDATTPYLIDATYDNGDGTHPNAAGSIVIATKLRDFIQAL